MWSWSALHQVPQQVLTVFSVMLLLLDHAESAWATEAQVHSVKPLC